MMDAASHYFVHAVSEDDFLSSIKDVNAIGKRVDRTAEQPEAIKWSDIGGLEKAKVY
jgi:hypothetical protein